MGLVRNGGATARQVDASRRTVIARINEASKALTLEALSIVEALATSRFGFEAKDESGTVSWVVFSAGEVPPFSQAHAVFRLAGVVRTLKSRDQAAAMRAFALEATLSSSEVDRFSAELEGDAAEAARSSLAVAQHCKDLDALRSRLPTTDRDLLLSDDLFVSSAAWFTWALPIEVAANACDGELTEASAWFDRVRGAMYRPLPVDDDSPASTQRWMRLWQDYEDCGHAFGVIGTWLKSLAVSTEGRRCRVCYRHLAPGMRHFCATHRRTSDKRQDARELHISDLYRPLAERRIRTCAKVRRRLGSWSLPKTKVDAMVQLALRAGLGPELAVPAGTLAAAINMMGPALDPPARDLIQEVFGRVFDIARQPFEGEAPMTVVDRIEMERQRREAIRWLGWETFVKAVFGPSLPVAWSGATPIGEGCDVDHPVVAGAAVPPQKIVLDMLHLGAWRTVEEQFDRFAYLNPRSLLQMRRGDTDAGQPPMSLARIADAVGISPEAVRQNLLLAEGRGRAPSGRDRIVATGLARLEAQLKVRTRAHK